MASNINEKLKDIFDNAEKAAQIVRAHPGQNIDQVRKSVNTNIVAHVSASNHIGLFVSKVLNRKGDLKTLADTTTKRIILSDIRIENTFKKLSVDEKTKRAEAIYNVVLPELMSYFEKLKGKKLEQKQISEELTVTIVKKIAETLKQF